MEKGDGKGDDVPPLEDRPLPTHIWPDGEEATVVEGVPAQSMMLVKRPRAIDS